MAGRRLVRRRPAVGAGDGRTDGDGGDNGTGPTAEWVSRRLLGQLDAVLDRGLPVLFVYGDDDPYHRDFETARPAPLGRLVDRPGARVRVERVPGQVHGLTSSATQDAVLAAIDDWATTELLQPADVEPGR